MEIINNNYIRVIPNHFNRSLQVTLSELDRTWYYKLILLPMFTRLSTVQFPVTFPLFMFLRNEVHHLTA